MKITAQKIKLLIKRSVLNALRESSYKDLPDYKDPESARAALDSLLDSGRKVENPISSNPHYQKEIIRLTLAYANNWGLRKVEGYKGLSKIFVTGDEIAGYWNHVYGTPKISESEAEDNIDKKLIKESLKEIQKNLEFMAKIQKDFNYKFLESLSTPEKILKEVIEVQYQSVLKEYEEEIKSQKNVNFKTLTSWYIMTKIYRDLSAKSLNLIKTIENTAKHRIFKQIQSKATENPDVFDRENFFVIHYIGAFAGKKGIFDRVISFIPDYAGKINKNEEAGVLYHKSVKKLSDGLAKKGHIGAIIDGYITAMYSGDVRSTRYSTSHVLSGGDGVGGLTPTRSETGYARYAGDASFTGFASPKEAILNPNQYLKDGNLFFGGYTETFFDNWKVSGLICDWETSLASKVFGRDALKSWKAFQQVVNEYKIPLYDKNFNQISLNDIEKILKKKIPKRVKK